jgi:hypothetical protein
MHSIVRTVYPQYAAHVAVTTFVPPTRLVARSRSRKVVWLKLKRALRSLLQRRSSVRPQSRDAVCLTPRAFQTLRWYWAASLPARASCWAITAVSSEQRSTNGASPDPTPGLSSQGPTPGLRHLSTLRLQERCALSACRSPGRRGAAPCAHVAGRRGQTGSSGTGQWASRCAPPRVNAMWTASSGARPRVRGGAQGAQ